MLHQAIKQEEKKENKTEWVKELKPTTASLLEIYRNNIASRRSRIADSQSGVLTAPRNLRSRSLYLSPDKRLSYEEFNLLLENFFIPMLIDIDASSVIYSWQLQILEAFYKEHLQGSSDKPNLIKKIIDNTPLVSTDDLKRSLITTNIFSATNGLYGLTIGYLCDDTFANEQLKTAQNLFSKI